MSYVGNTNTTQAFTPAIDYFSGNGSTVAFTLSRPVASVAQVQVVVNNVAQNPTDAYTVLNNTITFTGAPSSGTNNIYVYYTSPITQVIQPGQGTVTSSSFGPITDFTTTGNTILGNASTDTLNVGNGGLVKDANGNVGIGTSSPYSGSRADIQIAISTANYAFQIRTFDAGTVDGSTTAKVFRAVNSGGGNWANAQYDAWAHIWTRAGTEIGRFDSSGTLLIGRTIAVSGQTRLGLDATASIAGFVSETGPTTTVIHGRFYNGNGNVGNISTNGSATTYSTSSDYRLKHDIAPMTSALVRVAALKPVTYKWNADESVGEGFIAHELQAVVPDAVVGEKDAVDAEGNPVYQGIDTSFLVATLTAAIQEQQAIITALTARVIALENK
jgi:hypothetical protein